MLQQLSSIQLIVELALWSSRVQGEKAVSLLLCSPPETGKTTLLQGFGHLDGVYWLNDATAWGIAKHLKKQLRDGELRCLIIPDLIQSLAHKQETVEGFVGLINGLIEEGEAHIATYAYAENIHCPKPIGLITAIPMGELAERRHRWQRVGFTSRLLPVSWDYSAATLDLIYQHIEAQAVTLAKMEIDFPVVDIPVMLDPALAHRMEGRARVMGASEQVYGFRYQRHFQRLAKAAALRRSEGKPTMVEPQDIELVLHLSEFCNLERKMV